MHKTDERFMLDGKSVGLDRRGTPVDEARVYHLMSPGFAGEMLYPLAELRHRLPETYAAARAKYAGREWLLERPVPPLGCRWQDVVFLSPISPRLIYGALHRLGLLKRRPRWLSLKSG